MSIVKNTLDFLMRHVLRIRRQQDRSRKVGGGLDSDQPVTLRTFPPGGDPFDDRIEFHLRNRPGVPSGFRVPPAEHGDN